MWTPAELRALEVFERQGATPVQAQWMMQNLRDSGLRLADLTTDELVCRWVPISEQAVPPEADTIIRTITTTFGDGSSNSQTFWLDGLRQPHLAG